jgi:hypothetical protein
VAVTQNLAQNAGTYFNTAANPLIFRYEFTTSAADTGYREMNLLLTDGTPDPVWWNSFVNFDSTRVPITPSRIFTSTIIVPGPGVAGVVVAAGVVGVARRRRGSASSADVFRLSRGEQ